MALGKKSKVALASLLVIIVLLVIAIGVTANYITTYVNENSQSWIGRKVHVDDIDINIFIGALKLRNIDVFEQNGTDTFASIKTLKVNIDLPALYNEKYVIKDLTIDELDVAIKQRGGVFNFQDIVDFHASDGSATVDSTNTTDTVVWALKKIAISNSNIHYADAYLPIPVDITELNFSLPSGIHSHKHDLEGHLKFVLNNAGKLATDLEYHLETDDFSAVLDIENLDLSIAQPFLVDYLNLTALTGFISSQLTMDGLLNDPANMDVSGSFSINNFEYIDHNEETVGSFEKLDITIDSLNAAQDQYAVHRIALVKPQSVFHYYENTDNFSNLIKPTTSAEDTSETMQALRNLVDEPNNIFAQLAEQIQETVHTYKASHLRVDSIEITEGNFTYHDHTLLKPFAYTVSDFHVLSNEFYFDKDSVLMLVETTLNNGGKLTTNAILHPKHREDLDFEVEIDKMDLTSISPYFYEYLGHDIDSGLLRFNTSIAINDSSLNSNNHVVITEMVLGKKEKHENAAKLPVKTAVAALKDRKGVIELDIPIVGDLNDPNYKVGKAVVKILKNLVVKAASAPIKAAGNVTKRKERLERLK